MALNTTMYGVVDAMIRPYIGARDPGRIHRIEFTAVAQKYAPQIERAFRDGFHGSDGVTAARKVSGVVESGGEFVRTTWQVVRPNYFVVLGTQPIQGRTFAADDSTETNVVVVSDRLASKLFAERNPVGETVLLNEVPQVVIGVVTRSGGSPLLSADAWTVGALTPPAVRGSPQPHVAMIARLRYDIVPDDVAMIADLRRLARGALAVETGDPSAGQAIKLTVEPFSTREGSLSGLSLALVGAVVAIMLIACANLANLQLARGLTRGRELALRAAIGASRKQLMAHLVMETGLIALGGVLLGVVLTLWGMYLVTALIPPAIGESLVAPQLSWRVFLFAGFAGVVALAIVGLVPSLYVSRVDPGTLLKSGAGTGVTRTRRDRYGTMIVAQVAFALPLLIAAVILIRSFWYLHTGEYGRDALGYDPSQVVNVATRVPPADFARSRSLVGAMEDVIARMGAAKGVDAMAAMISRNCACRSITIVDAYGQAVETGHPHVFRVVTPNVFDIIRRPIVRGRDFNEADYDGEGLIIDEGTAHYLWKDANPIGRSIKFGSAQSEARWHRVIGVVGDSRGVRELQRRNPYWGFRLGEIYRVVTPQDTLIGPGRTVSGYAHVTGSAELAAIRIERQFTGQLTRGLRDITTFYRDNVTRGREVLGFLFPLFVAFALVGLGLVTIGLYGIVSYAVAERRQELAVRISVGAAPRDILRSVLREGLVLLLAGTAFGLYLTKGTVKWIAGYLVVDNDIYNAPLFGAIALVLVFVATVAAFMPAWRATRIDPIEALRHE